MTDQDNIDRRSAAEVHLPCSINRYRCRLKISPSYRVAHVAGRFYRDHRRHTDVLVQVQRYVQRPCAWLCGVSHLLALGLIGAPAYPEHVGFFSEAALTKNA